MELFTTPDGKEPLAHRAEMIAKYGVRVLDLVRASWGCAQCGAPVPAETLILPVVEYRTLQDATQYFHRFVGELATRPAQLSGVPGQELAVQIQFPVGRPMACPACGGAPTLREADAHVYSSAHQRDLVLHLTSQGPRRSGSSTARRSSGRPRSTRRSRATRSCARSRSRARARTCRPSRTRCCRPRSASPATPKR